MIKTYHIWCYDAKMASGELPWIVSICIDGVALDEPPSFATPEEAISFVGTGD